MNWPILSLITFLPLAGAAFIFLFARGSQEVAARNSRYMALWTTLITFALSLFVWFGFERGTAEFQFVERVDWFPAFNISYHMGVDGISMMFVLLSTLLMPICILASWDAIQNRVKEYMIAFLVLETMMVGMFCALDYVLFYVFFEGVLIPMLHHHRQCGAADPRKIYLAFRVLLYTRPARFYDAGAAGVCTWKVRTTVSLTLIWADRVRYAGCSRWLGSPCSPASASRLPMWLVAHLLSCHTRTFEATYRRSVIWRRVWLKDWAATASCAFRPSPCCRSDRLLRAADLSPCPVTVRDRLHVDLVALGGRAT